MLKEVINNKRFNFALGFWIKYSLWIHKKGFIAKLTFYVADVRIFLKVFSVFNV